MQRVLSSVVFTVALLCPWTASAQIPPPLNCSTTSQNLWVRDQLNTYYYWYRNLPSSTAVNPASFASPEAYLEAVRYRPIDNSYSYIQSAAASNAFFNDSQSIAIGLSYRLSATSMEVLSTYADTPAREAGIERGDVIVQINGRNVSEMIAAGTIGDAFGAREEGVANDLVFQKPNGERRQARVVKRLITLPTVTLARAFEVEGRRVGYVLFDRFVTPSTAALNEAFASLRSAGVTELVLDMRYNGGGLVDVAVHLSSLIGGARTSGQVLFNQVHNDKVGPVLNETARFTNPEQALNLQRLVVITTRSSASATELVINSLRAHMPVAVVGDTTFGKPVGAYGMTFCDKVLAATAFSIRNANNEGDYFDGIAPTCAAADDIAHQLGDTAERSLAEAIAFIRTGACSAQSQSAARALRLTREQPRASGWDALVNIW